MEDARFDRLTRTLSRVGTRRGTLAGLAGGLLLPMSGTGVIAAKGRRPDDDVQGETWRHREVSSWPHQVHGPGKARRKASLF